MVNLLKRSSTVKLGFVMHSFSDRWSRYESGEDKLQVSNHSVKCWIPGSAIINVDSPIPEGPRSISRPTTLAII